MIDTLRGQSKITYYKFLILLLIITLTSGCITYKTDTIVDSTITVDPGTYVSYKFSVPTHANVVGNFTASGGSGNDIRVLILDETSYTNWINGHSVSEYYDSGQETTGKIYATLSQGNYYIVYSNTFSTVSLKNIQTKVVINYTL